MAGLILGAVGATVGGMIGGPMGAQIGWGLGSMAGNMLFAPKQPDQFGPRLGDLKVQVSTYGNSIPIIYGSMRVAGNVIASSSVNETAHSQSSGGKGGGGPTQTTYTYSQTFAVAMCEGTIGGVRKIWANGKLIYNVADTADIATVSASNKNAAGMRFYLGSETQTADSLMQAYVGAADTPAYRGTAYVVFENMQLADYGNRAPNLEFEVLVSATTTVPFTSAADTITHATANVNLLETADGYFVSNQNGNAGFTSLYLTTQTVASWGSRLPYSYNNNIYYLYYDGVSFMVRKVPPHSVVPSTLASIASIYTIAFVVDGKGLFTATSGTDMSQPSVVTSNGEIWCFFGGYGSAGVLKVFRQSDRTLLWSASGFAVYNGFKTGLCFEFNGCVYYFNPYVINGFMPAYKINISTHLITSLGLLGFANSLQPSAFYNGKVYFANFYNLGFLSVYDLLSESFLADIALPFSTFATDILIDSNGFLIARTNGYFYKVLIGINSLASITPVVGNIVSNICTRAGLTTGQIDVTALTDTVDGYTVQRGTARSQIEQLMQAFYFDAVESDGKIKFVKRGGSAVLNIPEDDLAAHSYGSTMPDNLTMQRKQELELPVEYNVQYLDMGGAYQVNSQRSQRLTTSSQNKVAVNLAIAMTATKAKQISDVLMYDAWTGRTTYNFTTGWKYSYLEPTDVITLTKGSSVYTVRVASDDLNVGISGRMAVLEDASVYTQTAAAGEMIAPILTVGLPPLTDLMLMDIPLLRDQDDGIGFYAAACGYGTGWTGAQVFKSNDAGATWNSYGSAFLHAASIGVASTVLGNFAQNIFDETSSVTVVMINGTLASDTEINVLNGANIALLGNEIIQFKNATLVAAGTYTLTGLLRGRQGTEWASATHVAGDNFVLLSSTTTNLLTAPSAEYNLARKYRGVTFGTFLSDATTIDFTHTAVAQKPLSPVQIGGGRNTAGDITLNWVRRTRIGGGWGDFADVPLGEASESYSIDIMQGATVKRTLTSATPTVGYTSAQQVTDFGGNQASLLVNVYQISATIGRGFAGIRTV